MIWECDTKKTEENFAKMMNDAAALAGMINPYDTIGLYEQPKPRFIFKMPRVVPDQKSKFESDELFRRLGRESEVSLIVYEVEEYWTILLRTENYIPVGLRYSLLSFSKNYICLDFTKSTVCSWLEVYLGNYLYFKAKAIVIYK